MSNLYFQHAPYHHPAGHSQSNHNGHGRSRRAPRMSGNHHQSHKQLRPAARSPKEVAEAATMNMYRQNFDAARSFDLEDDEMFCPFNLLTEDDLQYMHTGSDRSSLSSGSPDQSPLQHQIQPSPAYMLPSSPYTASMHLSHQKVHQPLAQRTRNPIPIVDPATRAIASPPPSLSPGRQMMHRISA